MSNPIFSILAKLLFERPVKGLSFDQCAQRTGKLGEQVAQRAAVAPDTPANRETVCHLTGIERWGQRRLRVLLGESFVGDEYDRYRPDASLDWPALQAAFKAARADTVALVGALQKAGVAPDARVAHNMYGDLTVRGWLEYLGKHADIESKKIK